MTFGGYSFTCLLNFAHTQSLKQTPPPPPCPVSGSGSAGGADGRSGVREERRTGGAAAGRAAVG